MLGCDLESLIYPVSIERFWAEFWTRKPLLTQRPVEALSPLWEALEGGELRQLVQLGLPKGINVWPQNEDARFLARDVDEALRAYDGGASLYFHLGEASELLYDWATRFAVDIGQPQDRSDLSVFAAPAGARTRVHFDANENFTLQLRGTKRWVMAPNLHIEQPLSNWRPGLALPEHWKGGAPPQDVPKDGRSEAILGPGTMLYLPRGWWHEVDTVEGPALSVNWVLTPYSWAEAVARIVSETLSEEADFRANFGKPPEALQDQEAAVRRLRAIWSKAQARVSAQDAEVMRRFFDIGDV